MFPLPSWLRHCLCLVFPLPSRLRKCLSLRSSDPPVKAQVTRRGGAAVALAAVKLVLLSPRGDDVSGYDGGNLIMEGQPVLDPASSSVSFPTLGIKCPSQQVSQQLDFHCP